MHRDSDGTREKAPSLHTRSALREPVLISLLLFVLGPRDSEHFTFDFRA